MREDICGFIYFTPESSINLHGFSTWPGSFAKKIRQIRKEKFSIKEKLSIKEKSSN